MRVGTIVGRGIALAYEFVSVAAAVLLVLSVDSWLPPRVPRGPLVLSVGLGMALFVLGLARYPWRRNALGVGIASFLGPAGDSWRPDLELPSRHHEVQSKRLAVPCRIHYLGRESGAGRGGLCFCTRRVRGPAVVCSQNESAVARKMKEEWRGSDAAAQQGDEADKAKHIGALQLIPSVRRTLRVR